MAAETKIVLEEREIPTHWYNVVPDLASPPPPVLHPGTGQPIGPSDLAPLFPMAVMPPQGTQHSLWCGTRGPGLP